MIAPPTPTASSHHHPSPVAPPRYRRWAALALGVGLGLGVVGLGAIAPARAAERLSPEALNQALTALPSWSITGQTLTCNYEFSNFVESVEFVNQLVDPAETLGHHPDVRIAYNRVTINLTTHDAGGLTALDIRLAEQIQAVSDRPCLTLRQIFNLRPS